MIIAIQCAPLVSTTQAGALNTSIGDTISKFTAVVNNKWRITIFPEICIDCSDTNDELATGVNDHMGQIGRWCH
jgi:hypothetical protein